MAQATYEGWANYETWCVNLWLNNDESLYWDVMAMVADTDDNSSLAEAIQEFVENLADQCDTHAPSLFSDLLQAALREVDWYEIAQGFTGGGGTSPAAAELTFQWINDWEVGSHVKEYDSYEREPDTCEACLAIDQNGNVVASLGCIDDADDDYRRQVEADLTAEYRSKLGGKD